MFAIRQIQAVKFGVVTIALPATFQAKRVEIIILPIDDVDDEIQEPQQALQSVLLAAPTLSDDELSTHENVREWMNQWHVTDF
jgi:hypothetical protein